MTHRSRRGRHSPLYLIKRHDKTSTLYLCGDELFETVNSHPSPQDASDCGEARVIPVGEGQQRVKTPPRGFRGKLLNSSRTHSPSFDVSLLHKPGELPLREHGVVEVESGVLPDVRLPDAQGVDEPVELLVAVVVLGGPEGMGHALQTVHDGTGKVVCRVDSEGKGVAEVYMPLCGSKPSLKKTNTKSEEYTNITHIIKPTDV